jgi:hypothetical protein
MSRTHRKPRTIGGQPVTSSPVAVSARFQTGAGKHGGNAKQKNRRSRQEWRRNRQED